MNEKIPEISTGEFTGCTFRIIAVNFVSSVATVVFVITFPGAKDATTVAASEFRWFTEEKNKL